MELGDSALSLKKIHIRELGSALRHEVLELAGELGHETTIRADSDLHFLFKLYQAEKAKEKKSRKALKKAEDLILRLVSLQHDSVRAEGRKRKKKEKKPRLALLEEGISISKKTKKLLESIGITDERDMELVVGVIGEARIEDRVELILASDLGDDLVKNIFGEHTELLIVTDDDKFVSNIIDIMNKKDIIDAWKAENDRDPPLTADYDRTPSVLLEDYKQIATLLDLEAPEIPAAGAVEEKAPKYQSKPMHPADFLKVMLSMGFLVVREAKHGTLLRRGVAMLAVQRAHKSQMQLNGSTIKKKLMETGIDLGDFQEARDRLKL